MAVKKAERKFIGFPAKELSDSLAWLSRIDPQRITKQYQDNVKEHRRLVGTDPTILISAAVMWIQQDDVAVKTYWNFVEDYSERVRSRYKR